MMHPRPFLLTLLASLAALGSAHAATVVPNEGGGSPFVSISMGGSTRTDTWFDLSASANPGYPGFPGSGTWTAPMASSGGTATMRKVENGTGGGPYPAGDSMYYGGFSGDVNNYGGTLAVGDTVSPSFSVQTVVLQLQIGEAWTYDFYNDALPVLTYWTASGSASDPTGTLGSLYSVISARKFNGTVEMPSGEEDIYINTYALQYDLSSLGVEIAGYEVQWAGVQHAQLYGVQLDASTQSYTESVLPQAVPEPGVLGLGAFAGLMMLVRRRRAARA